MQTALTGKEEIEPEDVKDILRLGKKPDNPGENTRPRPLLFKFNTEEDKLRVLKSSGNLSVMVNTEKSGCTHQMIWRGNKGTNWPGPEPEPDLGRKLVGEQTKMKKTPTMSEKKMNKIEESNNTGSTLKAMYTNLQSFVSKRSELKISCSTTL